MGALKTEPTKSAKLPVLVARAIELESGYRVGILPRAGGWDNQDPDDISLIRIAANVRTIREGVERKSRESRRGMFKRKGKR